MQAMCGAGRTSGWNWRRLNDGTPNGGAKCSCSFDRPTPEQKITWWRKSAGGKKKNRPAGTHMEVVSRHGSSVNCGEPISVRRRRCLSRVVMVVEQPGCVGSRHSTMSSQCRLLTVPLWWSRTVRMLSVRWRQCRCVMPAPSSGNSCGRADVISHTELRRSALYNAT